MKTIKRKILLFFVICFSFILVGCEFDLGQPTYKFNHIEFNEETKTAIAIFESSTNKKEYSCQVKVEKEALDCEKEGYIIYLASVTVDGKTYSESFNIKTEPTGHNYVLYGFNWNDDLTVCKAIFVCDNNPYHTMELDASVSTVSEIPATCYSIGSRTCEASITYEGSSYKNTRTVELPQLEHDYKPELAEYMFSSEYLNENYIILHCAHDYRDTVSLRASVEISDVQETNDHGPQTKYTLSTRYQGISYSKDFFVDKANAGFNVCAYNDFEAQEGFAAFEGIRLYTPAYLMANENSTVLLLKQQQEGVSLVVDKLSSIGDILTDYDYALVCNNDYYNFMNFNQINIGHVIYFASSLSELKEGPIALSFTSAESTAIHVNYNLGYANYQTKDQLYRAFFTDYYNFLVHNTKCNLTSLGIGNVDDFLDMCQTWNAYGRNEMGGLGDKFGAYYLTKEENGTFESQPTTTFVGWCYQNNKYIDLLHHLELFFGYWRTDEGYSKNDPHGNDFFYSPWASFVDTCKFFFFTSATLTSKYSWFTIERSPRVHYMLDNVPGVGYNDLDNDQDDYVYLKTPSRLNYRFVRWENENGEEIRYAYSSQTVYAIWEHIPYQITYVNNGLQKTVTSYQGYRIPLAPYSKNGSNLKYYINQLGQKVELIDPVNQDMMLYLAWESVEQVLASFRIYSMNTQNATSEVTQYNGARIYKPGVALDASLYWLKLLVKSDSNGYYISEVVPSGTSHSQNFDYLILIYSGDSTHTYDSLVSMGLTSGMRLKFNINPNSFEDGEINLNASIITGSYSFNNLLLMADTNPNKYVSYYDQCQSEFDLPQLSRNGYNFLGWYKDGELEPQPSHISIDGLVVLYALWEQKIYNDVLDYIEDEIGSQDVLQIPLGFDGDDIVWSVSDENLVIINGELLTVSKQYQTHKRQTVTVTATYNGHSYSKQVTILPVEFETAEHPLAAYFSLGSIGSYKTYSERYKSTNQLFSDKFKDGFDFLYYAFATPQINGTISLNDSYISEVIKLKNNNIRISLVIDGANASALKNLVQVCNDTTLRQSFVNSIMQALITYNLDGVDIDWEFPGTSGLSGYTTELDIRNMNALLKELREAMNAYQDEGGSNYLLTCATPPTYWGVDRFDYRTINQYCDYVNMMSYDLNKTSQTSHVAHVHIPSNNYSYQFSCEYGIGYYSSLGLDKSKIILGAAAYGKAYKVTGSVDMSATCPALGVAATLGQVTGYNIPLQSVSWASGTIYYTGIQTLLNSGNFTMYHEYNANGKFVGSYIYSPTDKYFVTFDSVKGLQEKCNLAKQYDGMGIMLWAYGEDATDTVVNTLADNLG